MKPQEMIALFLIREKHKGENSFWNSYIASLPDNFSTPAYFSAAELSLLPHRLFKKVQEQINQLSLIIFPRMVKFCETNWPEMNNVLNFEVFRWAWYCINSRSVYFKGPPNEYVESDGNHIAMAPFLDLLNHSSTAKVGTYKSVILINFICNTHFH